VFFACCLHQCSAQCHATGWTLLPPSRCELNAAVHDMAIKQPLLLLLLPVPLLWIDGTVGLWLA
jgi:hypothetical protein